jgi:hypothetical protein
VSVANADAEGPSSLPPLLKALPAWHPGGWALPAVTLSFGSMAVLVLPFLYLERNALVRAIFRLPFDPAMLAIPTAAGAWAIASHCRHRPGRLIPRLWALSLALMTTAIAVWAVVDTRFVPRGRPLVHALTIAGTLSTLVLSLRLVKVNPNHWLLQSLALISVLVALLLGLPVIMFIEAHVIAAEQRTLMSNDAELAGLSRSVELLPAFKWSDMTKDVHGASETVERLRGLRVPDWIGDPYAWRAAALLGKSEGLKAQVLRLMDDTREGLVNGRGPQLALPEYSYNNETRAWEHYPDFDKLSTTTVSYYREIARLHAEVGARVRALGDQPVAGALREHLATRSSDIEAWANASMHSWTHRWLVPVVYPGQPSSPTVVDALRLPLPAAPGSPPIQAGHVAQLMGLSKAQAERLPPPACRNTAYVQNGIDYFRVDCYAYTMNAKGDGGTLIAEVRLVYCHLREGKPGTCIPAPAGSIAGGMLPFEVYYLFPVAAGSDATTYRQQVMRALMDAMSELHPDSKTSTPKAGPPTDGFSLLTKGLRYRVEKPRAVPNLNAIETQIFRP